ncbi:alkaline phosphatase D family protein [Caulobacter vibrioides]|uniref:Alkaline phosphatase D n=3 Tax=Caulobacter vibrioides TaxID=155892 RepID=Q9A801_CAUVC|nr:alkaline phosphatase [Caulobacter vibrioides]YP_002517009.1 alkaline phosphatase [Caulobacter vibrioides NA1000]AAK23544.1 alkaline phosphatase D [Caulobacter vibrioides CB15]ACL95101.1 alkaline phosphatase [Caulobacter vibrioides NA1000]ATC28369.1 alkaline phosphatase [Caulobacter vibrioides]QXZ53633.1 alkaline phosphatase [Caulobacter vibrioides]
MSVLDRYALSRRRMLAVFGGAAVSAMAIPLESGKALAQAVFQTYPFQLGVASGDPSSDGFVIWTRLAPEPLEIGYGMPSAPVAVEWEVGDAPNMRNIVAKGTAIAPPELGHAVHVEVGGLQPNRDYWYRFTAGRERSLLGRARTTPALGAALERVRFAVAGCQHYEQGYYTAYRRLAEENPDFVFCYGDYIYEYRGNRVWNSASGPVENVRQHFGGEIYSLDDYRRRYAQYKMDTDLQAAHAAAPWFTVWDDHEIDNNWVTDLDQDGVDPKIFNLRRQAAVQAYYENMPLRASSFPTGTSLQIYRRATYGQLLNLNLLDTRQYRTDQPCGDRFGYCDAVEASRAEVIGQVQEKWLTNGLIESKSTWNVLAQQIMMMDLDREPGEGKAVNPDSWAGYRMPRNRLLQTIRDRKVGNVVVLTGDEHQNYAGDLYLDGAKAEGAPIASEFVVTSISSGGDGVDQRADMARIQAANPILKFNNAQRGYALCDVTPKAFVTEFKVLDAITRRDGKLSTRAKWALEAGKTGIVQA